MTSGRKPTADLTIQMAGQTMRKYQALHSSVCFLCLVSLGLLDDAKQEKIGSSQGYFEILHNGKTVKVKRLLDLSHVLDDRPLQSMQQCPPTCLGPDRWNLGVRTTDELGILKIMEGQLLSGASALIDARTPNRHEKGTIPGSINIPYSVFHLDSYSPQLSAALEKLGGNRCATSVVTAPLRDRCDSTSAESTNDKWDFSSAKDLVIWCNGPEGNQSSLAIRGLLDLGYPSEKIRHYRGGIRLWKAFGLTTVIGG